MEKNTWHELKIKFQVKVKSTPLKRVMDLDITKQITESHSTSFTNPPSPVFPEAEITAGDVKTCISVLSLRVTRFDNFEFQQVISPLWEPFSSSGKREQYTGLVRLVLVLVPGTKLRNAWNFLTDRSIFCYS